MRRSCGISWCLRRSSVSLCLRELSEMIDRARIACQLSERKKAIYGHRCFKSASFRDTPNARDPDDAPRALRAARGRPGMRDVVQRRNGTAFRSPAHVPKPAQVALLSCVTGPRSFGPLAVCSVLLTGSARPASSATALNNGNMCLSWCNAWTCNQRECHGCATCTGGGGGDTDRHRRRRRHPRVRGGATAGRARTLGARLARPAPAATPSPPPTPAVSPPTVSSPPPPPTCANPDYSPCDGAQGPGASSCRGDVRVNCCTHAWCAYIFRDAAVLTGS